MGCFFSPFDNKRDYKNVILVAVIVKNDKNLYYICYIVGIIKRVNIVCYKMVIVVIKRKSYTNQFESKK